MPDFYKIANIKSGNCNINNFLPAGCNKGWSVTSVHCVQSISHDVIKQGLTSVVGVRTSPGSVMRICITANDEVSSSSLQPITGFSNSQGGGGTTSSYGRQADSRIISLSPPPLDVLIFSAVRSLEQ